MKYPFLFLFFAGTLSGQNKSVWDTIRYQKFRSNLIIGIFQSYRSFNNNFTQTKTPDSLGVSENALFAESNNFTGVEVTYDKFGFSIGLKSTPPDLNAGKGDTRAVSTNLNFGGNIWYLENSFRYFKGFYDNNTPAYDSGFKESGIYYQQKKLTNTLLRSKFMYFANHERFAFRAGYACNYRQLKSSASWILGGSITYFDMQNDSAFIPMPTRHYYGDQGSMNGLTVFGISTHFGGSATLVIMKGFFINALFVAGPEQQWRNYAYHNDGTTAISYISVSGNFRGSIGVNLKRFYVLSSSSNDFTIYHHNDVVLTNKSLSGSFTFGWRFNSRTPEYYKKFQETKFYKSI